MGYAAGQKLPASMMPGVVGIPTGTGSSGTVVSTGTETRDAILGNYVFTSLGTAHWYRVVVSCASANSDQTSATAAILRVRDGGTSTPTNSSTLVAEVDGSTPGSGSGGRCPLPISKVTTFTAGTHTLATFWLRGGPATGNNLTPVGDRQLYVEYMGPVS